MPHCMTGCKMVAVPALNYHVGQFNATQAHAAGSIADCQAACIADPACVQATWAHRHHPYGPYACVMYQAISPTLLTGAQGCLGWVKCAASATSAACAAVDTSPNGN